MALWCAVSQDKGRVSSHDSRSKAAHWEDVHLIPQEQQAHLAVSVVYLW